MVFFFSALMALFFSQFISLYFSTRRRIFLPFLSILIPPSFSNKLYSTTSRKNPPIITEEVNPQEEEVNKQKAVFKKIKEMAKEVYQQEEEEDEYPLEDAEDAYQKAEAEQEDEEDAYYKEEVEQEDEEDAYYKEEVEKLKIKEEEQYKLEDLLDQATLNQVNEDIQKYDKMQAEAYKKDRTEITKERFWRKLHILIYRRVLLDNKKNMSNISKYNNSVFNKLYHLKKTNNLSDLNKTTDKRKLKKLKDLQENIESLTTEFEEENVFKH